VAGSGNYFSAVIVCGFSACITGNKLLQWLNWCSLIGMAGRKNCPDYRSLPEQ